MALKMPSAGDLTGTRNEALRKQQAEEAQRQAELTMVAKAAEDEAIQNEVLDVTETPHAPTVVDEVQMVASDEDATAIVRVAEDLQDVTIGSWRGSLVAGRKYKVPKNVADNLRWAGVLYERA